MGRRDLDEVTTTLPEESAEYILSLSSDRATAVIEDECDRRWCRGVGGGGGCLEDIASDKNRYTLDIRISIYTPQSLPPIYNSFYCRI